MSELLRFAVVVGFVAAFGCLVVVVPSVLWLRRQFSTQAWADHDETRTHVTEQTKSLRDRVEELDRRAKRHVTTESDRTRRVLEFPKTYTDPVPAPSFLTYEQQQPAPSAPLRPAQHRRVQ